MKNGERFWSKVARGESQECWEWQASLGTNGYGKFFMAGHSWDAHRAAYWLTYGPPPPGKLVLHSCDNRRCCNPSHLRAGTYSENLQEAYARQRRKARGPDGPDAHHFNREKTHCLRGHPFDQENTIFLTGERRCRECHRQRGRRYHARRVARSVSG